MQNVKIICGQNDGGGVLDARSHGDEHGDGDSLHDFEGGYGGQRLLERQVGLVEGEGEGYEREEAEDHCDDDAGGVPGVDGTGLGEAHEKYEKVADKED